MTQLALPVDVAPAEIARQDSLPQAIDLCVRAAGLTPKALQISLHWDKGQWSRWTSGQEGITWPKLAQLQDYCGNDVPSLWMLGRRGYDLHSVRRLESETEKENRQLREENAALRRVLLGQAVRP